MHPAINRSLFPLLWIAFSLLLPAACGGTEGVRTSCEDSPAAVRGVVERIITADNSRDLEGVLSGYTDDVIWLPPTGDSLSGKESIRPRYEGLFSGFQPDFSLGIDGVHVSTDLALVRGTTQGKLTSNESGEVQNIDDKFLAVLRCQNGQWRVSHLMWSPRKPAK